MAGSDIYASYSMRLASRVPCANRVLLLMWQELSALYLELGDHPGGYQYLNFGCAR